MIVGSCQFASILREILRRFAADSRFALAKNDPSTVSPETSRDEAATSRVSLPRRLRNIAKFCLISVLMHPLLVVGSRSQPRVPGSTASVPCSQSTASREALIRRAEKLRFTVRRVEFLGTTYTRDEVLRRTMTEFQEGDLFTREKLVNSLRNMSKLRNEIYPVKLKNVELSLNERQQTVDITICFKPKRHLNGGIRL